MTESTQFIRCDRRYLTARFGSILFVFMVLFFIDLLFWHTIVIAGLMGTLSLCVLMDWGIKKTWKFSISSNQIRTEKLFTGPIDLRTPLDQIVGINAYEGILEALLDVGTIEISTASSQHDHVAIKWPHLRNARKVADRLEILLKEKRSSNQQVELTP